MDLEYAEEVCDHVRGTKDYPHLLVFEVVHNELFAAAGRREEQLNQRTLLGLAFCAKLLEVKQLAVVANTLNEFVN